nr:hypothetical protein 2 [Halomonadaceae bacterium]
MKRIIKDALVMFMLTILFFCFVSLGFKLGDYGYDPLISPTDKLSMEIKGGVK